MRLLWNKVAIAMVTMMGRATWMKGCCHQTTIRFYTFYTKDALRYGSAPAVGSRRSAAFRSIATLEMEIKPIGPEGAVLDSMS